MKTLKELEAEMLNPDISTRILLNQLKDVLILINKRFPSCSCFRNEVEKVKCHGCYLRYVISGFDEDLVTEEKKK